MFRYQLYMQRLNTIQTKYEFLKVIHVHSETNTCVVIVQSIQSLKFRIAKIYSNWAIYQHELRILSYLQSTRIPKIYDTETFSESKIIGMKKFSHNGYYFFEDRFRMSSKQFSKQILEVPVIFYYLILILLFFFFFLGYCFLS